MVLGLFPPPAPPIPSRVMVDFGPRGLEGKDHISGIYIYNSESTSSFDL